MAKAFFVRQTTNQDWSEDAIKTSRIFIGWAEAKGLIEMAAADDYYGLREIIKNRYYPNASTYHGAGISSGHLWRFIKEMRPGDLVVIPCGEGLYIGEVTGDCQYAPEEVDNDRAYYRQVKWLYDKAVPRTYFKNDMQRAMKGYGTVIDISQCGDDIKHVLKLVHLGEKPVLRDEIHDKVFSALLEQLYDGRLNDYDFERLIEAMLKKKGYATYIVPRRNDTGTDIEAGAPLFGGFSAPVFVQVKQYKPHTTVEKEVFEKLLLSMHGHANYGVVVTTAEMGDEARQYIMEVNEGDGPYQLAFIGGEQLCEELIAAGLFPDFDF